MNRTLKHTLPLVALLFLPMTACENETFAEETLEDVQNAAEDVGDWTSEKWSDFVDETNDSVSTLESRLSELHEAAEEKGSEVSDDVSEAVADARQQVDELGNASEEDYESLSQDAQDALENAQERLENAWAELKGN